MNDTIKFENKELGFCVEAKEHDGIPVFAANLVCESLDLGNVTKALYGLDDDEKITLTNSDGNPRAGIPHQLNYVTEARLYSLILRSRKPEAKAFKRWVTHEVLPAIRKHGVYVTNSTLDQMLADPRHAAELLNRLADERDRRELAEDKIRYLTPDVPYGTPSNRNGLPRTSLVKPYYRGDRWQRIRKTVTVTEWQRSLFDLDD